MAKIGRVVPREYDVEWQIPDFFSLSDDDGEFYYSSLFSFAGESFNLKIYPNGLRAANSVGYIGLYLKRGSFGPHFSLEYSLGFKTFDGKKDSEVHRTYIFDNTENAKGVHKYLSRLELLERISDLAPSGALTVFCSLKCPRYTEDAGHVGIQKCSYCKITLEAHDDLSSHQQKCMEKPIKCPECAAVVVLKDWYEHECQMARAEASVKLSQDFKSLMLNGYHSDTIIQVKEEAFRLHKSILSVRNPFFHSMFANDMKEKSTGIVSIDDCEPEVFRSFMHFIYIGKVDKISPENVYGLYKIADKYQEDQLKKECLQFMMNTISVDSFCDFIVLSLIHDEKKLLQIATEFFCNKAKEVIRTVKWQTFMREYPAQANELYIKALDYSDDKYISIN